MLFRCILIALFIYLPNVGISKPYLEKRHNSKKCFKENEIILNYKEGIERNRLENITKELDTEIIYRSHFANFVTVRFDKKRDIWQLIKKFESFPEIVFAEPNGIAHIFWTPNDPLFQLYQWNFDDSHLNMPLAWDIERGGNSSVIVSILDTGIAYENYLIPSYEQDSVLSSDGYYHRSPDLAITNFVDGYDFINNDSHPNDENGHGTHVCGTIAQSTNNNKGVAGMAFNVSIMPVRVLGAYGSGTLDKIADGIYYSYQNGADVLSMSLGGLPGDSIGYGTVHQAIIAATNAGAIVVVAAGNGGVGQLSYPAGFEECIAVSATDIDNNLAPYSQWGEGIDVVAPGGDYFDTIPGTPYVAGILQSTYSQINDGFYKATVDTFDYWFLQGTSMAAPHVSALVALLISHGITSPSAIKQTIYSTTTDLGSPGYDTYFGHGLINPPVSLGVELLFSSMPIIQNPYNQQYIDIWIVSQRPLLNDMPDPCKVTLAGEDSYHSFEKVAEQTYRTDFFFDTSGTATVYVTARDTSGTQGSYTRNFTVTKVIGRIGGFAESEDTRFRITIPEDMYDNTYWIVIATEEMGLPLSSYTPLSNVYKCGPDGKSINVPSVIRFSFDKEIFNDNKLQDIGIYRKNGDELEYINTEIDVSNGYAYSKVSEFGSYILILWPGKGGSSEFTTKGLSLNCYPVPASQNIFFDYAVPFASYVDIALYDVSGRRVKNIEQGAFRDYGMYTGSCKLDNGKLPSGVYFLKIILSNSQIKYEESKKIILMR